MRLRQNGLYTDVELVAADKQRFPAHRAVLAAQSEVFNAMFSPRSNMQEAFNHQIELPDIPGPALEALLSYLYGSLPSLSPDIVLQLFMAADKYGILGLRDECVLVLLECLDMESVALVAQLASCHQLMHLWQACVRFSAAPQKQVAVFSSEAYRDLWRDSPQVAQAFTAQVRMAGYAWCTLVQRCMCTSRLLSMASVYSTAFLCSTDHACMHCSRKHALHHVWST
jgi:hypothetical protein